MLLRPALPLTFVLAACAGTAPTTLRTETDPGLEHTEQEKLDADAARRDFARVLLQLDQAMDSYVTLLSSRGVPRSDTELQRLDKLLHELVSGRIVRGKRTGSNTNKLIALAADSSDKAHQGVALAALGFADEGDVMPVILQGAQLDDPDLVDRAILGLALRRDPRTPPGVIVAVLENRKHGEQGRIQAAWTLTVLQENGGRDAEIVPVWRRILAETADEHPLIVATAVRGLGLTRDAADAELVARFLTHPTPKVRMNAAVALGKMNAQAQHEKLLEALGPGEKNPNVRLAVRKALQALAGGVDRGYDVASWRKEFERGAKQ